MQNYANCINTDNTLNDCRDIAHMKNKTPRLNAKTKCQPTYRKTQVSVVAVMRFRGVASLNQEGAPFWSGGTEEARSKGPTAGDSWKGGSQSPSPPATMSGLRCKLPSGVRGGGPAAESFSCTLCHQIASPGTSVYTLAAVC